MYFISKITITKSKAQSHASKEADQCSGRLSLIKYFRIWFENIGMTYIDKILYSKAF